MNLNKNSFNLEKSFSNNLLENWLIIRPRFEKSATQKTLKQAFP